MGKETTRGLLVTGGLLLVLFFTKGANQASPWPAKVMAELRRNKNVNLGFFQPDSSRFAADSVRVCVSGTREMRPFQERIAEFALGLLRDSTDVGPYCGQNDCYDLLTRIIFAVRNSTSIDRVEQFGWNSERSTAEFGWEELRLPPSGGEKGNPVGISQHVQTGDFICARNSPYDTGRSHWGICLRQGDEVVVIHRANAQTLQIDPLGWFLRNCPKQEDVEIRRNPQLEERQVELAIPRMDFSDTRAGQPLAEGLQ